MDSCYGCGRSLAQPTSSDPELRAEDVQAYAVELGMPPGSIAHHHGDGYFWLKLLASGRRWRSYHLESVGRVISREEWLGSFPAFMRDYVASTPGERFTEDWLIRVRYRDSPFYVEWRRGRAGYIMGPLDGNEDQRSIMRAHAGIRLVRGFRTKDNRTGLLPLSRAQPPRGFRQQRRPKLGTPSFGEKGCQAPSGPVSRPITTYRLPTLKFWRKRRREILASGKP